jgi:hypothetical protein
MRFIPVGVATVVLGAALLAVAQMGGHAVATGGAATVDELIDAFHESMSVQPGEEHSWRRFESLFTPEGRLIAARPAMAGADAMMMSPSEFAEKSGAYLAKQGLHERSIHKTVEQFGNIAHAFSTYESRKRPDDAEPYVRGIYSLQMMRHEGRWFIIAALWDFERQNAQIPPQYLPAPTPEAGG